MEVQKLLILIRVDDLKLYQSLHKFIKWMSQSSHFNFYKNLNHAFDVWVIWWKIDLYCYIDGLVQENSIWLLMNPDSKVHGANMGPTWVLSAPDGPHVGSMTLAIRGESLCDIEVIVWLYLGKISPYGLSVTFSIRVINQILNGNLFRIGTAHSEAEGVENICVAFQ